MLKQQEQNLPQFSVTGFPDPDKLTNISGRALWGNHRLDSASRLSGIDISGRHQIGAGENSGNHHIWISWFSQT